MRLPRFATAKAAALLLPYAGDVRGDAPKTAV